MNQPIRRLPLPEFVALLAMLFATIAFSIDAMLPALPVIAGELSPDAVNRAQLVVTAFMAGLGLGTLISGPLSDAFGRKRIINIGFLVYMIAALAAIYANSLTLLLAARFAQGLGAAGPRIAGQAMVRDLYEGREMARISSFVMMVFILVPALAPSLGAVIIGLAGWRAVFAAFVVFALIGAVWMNLRQPETLPVAARRPFRATTLWAGTREVLGDRQVVIITAVLSLGFGQMMALLSSAQQLFDSFGRGAAFPLWFAGLALLSSMGTVLNARLVMRLGMRAMARGAYLMQIVVAGIYLVTLIAGPLPAPFDFALFFIWAVSLFAMAGITFGNLNALALQRMGHIAGMTASIMAAVSTLAAVAIAVPVGLAFDGTPAPAVLAALICSALAAALMRLIRG
ncbi:MFS transporter [Paracoccus sp. p4-l81]|uniref:MFS transporter n=1 Tax=Paracoccus sp. p4-l81 TaxID=3342806 RepID=UPI0035B6BA54